MGLLRKLIFAVVPKRWAKAMEADSRRWVQDCPCGYQTSIWQMGGIRYKAAGKPWIMGKCANCGKVNWAQLRWVDAAPSLPGAAANATRSNDQ